MKIPSLRGEPSFPAEWPIDPSGTQERGVYGSRIPGHSTGVVRRHEGLRVGGRRNTHAPGQVRQGLRPVLHADRTGLALPHLPRRAHERPPPQVHRAHRHGSSRSPPAASTFCRRREVGRHRSPPGAPPPGRFRDWRSPGRPRPGPQPLYQEGAALRRRRPPVERPPRQGGQLPSRRFHQLLRPRQRHPRRRGSLPPPRVDPQSPSPPGRPRPPRDGLSHQDRDRQTAPGVSVSPPSSRLGHRRRRVRKTRPLPSLAPPPRRNLPLGCAFQHGYTRP